MGGFYGSIHFRASTRDDLLPHIEEVATRNERRFLCGPPLNGWVGAYPSGNGQDERDATLLAEKWAGDLLYLAVHDDDLLIYRYFRNGALVDAYWSAPGYFGEADRSAQEAQSGAPETYAHLLVGGIARARAILDRTKGKRATMEVERLLAFTKLLGIENGATSYEYLEAGERQGIRRWKDFVHVPDRAGAEARANAERRAQFAQWESEGLLLGTKELPLTPGRRPGGQVEVKVGRQAVTVDFEATNDVIGATPNLTATARGDRIELRSNDATVTLLAGAEDATAERARDRTQVLFMLVPALTQSPPGQALATLLRYVPEERRGIAETKLRGVLPPPPWTEHDAMCLAQLTGRESTRSESVSTVSVTPDGRWMVCGTTRGLRVAACADLIGLSTGSPIPWRFTYEIAPRALAPNPGPESVYATLYDEATNQVIFAGFDGRLRTMSLIDGKVETLFDLFKRATVLRMVRSDPDTLAIYAQPDFPNVTIKGSKPVVYLLRYQALLGRAAGERPIDPPLEPHARVALATDDVLPSPVEPVRQALSATHARSPQEVHLEHFEIDGWPTEAEERRLIAPLLEAGFEGGPRFIARALEDTRIQFFADRGRCMSARVLSSNGQDTTLTIWSQRSDGSSFAVTNRIDLGLDVPEDSTVRHIERADGRRLLDLMSRTRPEGSWEPLACADLPNHFERAYQRQRAWREARGFSEAEAGRFVVARSRVRPGS